MSKRRGPPAPELVISHPAPGPLIAFGETDDAQLLSKPGQPYDAAELQRTFVGMSSREVYSLLCKRSGCKPLSCILKMLSERPGEWSSTTELDFSRTYVGPRGVIPLLELCKLFPSLTALNLSRNYLTNQSIWHACKVLQHHPSLSRLELGGNDVSWTAGMCVLELVSRNATVTRVGLNDTLIHPSVQQSILQHIRRNLALGPGGRGGRRGPNPSSHPMTIRIRSLKRFFRDALARDAADGAIPLEGRLPRAIVADGVRELHKLVGKESELDTRSPAFFDRYLRRVNGDTVDWEAFLLIVMCEDVLVNVDAVEELRRVFNHFDMDGAGYIGFSDLREAMTLMRKGYEPTPAEVQSKMDEYGGDETMTLNWDEFLLLMYDKGPTVGALSTFHVHTPMKQRRPQHY